MNPLALIAPFARFLVPNKPIWKSLTFMAGFVWALVEALDGSSGLAAMPVAVQGTVHALNVWFNGHGTWLIGLGIAKRFSDQNGTNTPLPPVGGGK